MAITLTTRDKIVYRPGKLNYMYCNTLLAEINEQLEEIFTLHTDVLYAPASRNY